MARIRVHGVLEALGDDFRVVIERAVREKLPDADIDERELFREVCRQAGRRFNIWTTGAGSFRRRAMSACGPTTAGPRAPLSFPLPHKYP